MTEGTGVPSAAGVAALESDTLSAMELLEAATLPDGAGDSTESLGSTDSLGTGDSSLGDFSSSKSRRSAELTDNVTSKPCLLPDFRRPSPDLGGILRCYL